MMLALALYEDQLCPSGHWLPESSAAENEDSYRGRNCRCHACTAVEAERARLKDNPPGLMFGAQIKQPSGG
jgi:hypothetical protein